MTAEEAADVLQAQQTIAAADLEAEVQRVFEEEEARAGVIEAQPRRVRIEISTPNTLRPYPDALEIWVEAIADQAWQNGYDRTLEEVVRFGFLPTNDAMEIHRQGVEKGAEKERHRLMGLHEAEIAGLKSGSDLRAKRTSHSVYNLNSHLVFVPTYRQCVLKGRIADHLQAAIPTVCDRYGWEQLALEVMLDHVHVFLSAPPTTAPMVIGKTLKSILAVDVFRTFPGLKRRHFWGSGLWSDGCRGPLG